MGAATSGMESRVFSDVLPKCAGLTMLQAESRLRKADVAFDTAEWSGEQAGQLSSAPACNLATCSMAESLNGALMSHQAAVLVQMRPGRFCAAASAGLRG